MTGCHHVRGISSDGILIPATHNRLRGHMNHHLGTALSYRRLEPLEIANVGVDRLHRTRDSGLFEETRVGRWAERVSGYTGSEGIQPEEEPASLEAGMSGGKPRGHARRSGQALTLKAASCVTMGHRAFWSRHRDISGSQCASRLGLRTRGPSLPEGSAAACNLRTDRSAAQPYGGQWQSFQSAHRCRIRQCRRVTRRP
jgi:hypothetical protein